MVMRAILLLFVVSPLLAKGQRERKEGEIIPSRVENSRNLFRDNVEFAAEWAIDLDFDTMSRAAPGADGTYWTKLYFDKPYCVEKVEEYNEDGSNQYVWTCTNVDCSGCEGGNCPVFTLTVTKERSQEEGPTASDCKFGDTVKLELNKAYADNRGSVLAVIEIAVFEKIVKATTCNKPSIQFGTVKPDSSTITEGEKYTLTCNLGYELDQGTAEMTCLNSGQLSMYSSCKAAGCYTAPTITNGKVSPQFTSSGGILSVTCNPGYVLVPDDGGDISCSHGNLGTAPECKPGWTDIEKDKYYEFSVDATPLEIWTNKAILQPGGILRVQFWSDSNQAAGSVSIDLEKKKYNLLNCLEDWADIPQEKAALMLAEPETIVWKFLINPDPALQIYYNDIEIVKMPISSCPFDWGRRTVWSRRREKIRFPTSDDTASKQFRAATSESSVVCTSKRAVFLRGDSASCDKKWYLKTTDSAECYFGKDEKVIWTELHKCGTVASYDQTHVHYENTVTCGIPTTNSDPNSIIRQANELINYKFKCSYLRTGNVKDPQWSVPGVTQVELKDEGYLEFALEVYDKDFTKKEKKFPLELELNSDLHLQLSVDSEDPMMTLAIVEVKVTTQAEDNKNYQGSVHYLWRSGCKHDDTAVVIPTSPADPKKQRFTFKVFKFVSGSFSDPLYIHATVKVCGRETAELCTFSCAKRRRREALPQSGSQELSADQNLYKVSLGPFVTSDPAYEGVVNSGVCERMRYDIMLLTMTPLSSIFMN